MADNRVYPIELASSPILGGHDGGMMVPLVASRYVEFPLVTKTTQSAGQDRR